MNAEKRSALQIQIFLLVCFFSNVGSGVGIGKENDTVLLTKKRITFCQSRVQQEKHVLRRVMRAALTCFGQSRLLPSQTRLSFQLSLYQ
jgi:hypothetical protein